MKPGALLLVGSGGFLGAIARYAIGAVVAARLGTSWPFGTFLINISGCFAIAFFMTLTTERFVVKEAWRLLFPIGFVGAYTTFSTYEYETARLVAPGGVPRAPPQRVLAHPPVRPLQHVEVRAPALVVLAERRVQREVARAQAPLHLGDLLLRHREALREQLRLGREAELLQLLLLLAQVEEQPPLRLGGPDLD